MNRTVFLLLLSALASAVCGIFIDRLMTVAPLGAVVLAFVLCAFFVCYTFMLSRLRVVSNKNLTEESEVEPLELPKSEPESELAEIWYLYDLVHAGAGERCVDHHFD